MVSFISDVTFPALIFADFEFVNKVMEVSTTVFIDATFSCAPRVTSEDQFSQRRMQVLNFVAEAYGNTYPIMHCVMASKRYPLYRKLFEKIVQVFPSFRPKYIMADWERALRKAIRLEVAGVRLLGCR